MKKVSIITIFLITVLTVTIIPVNAMNSGENVTEEEIIENQKQEEEKAKYLEENPRITPRASGGKTLGIDTGIRQDNSYYCGPASAKVIIKYIKGTNVSQSTLASEMGTTSSSGSSIYNLKDVIRNRTGKNYVVSSTSSRGLSNSVSISIESGMPLVYNVKTKKLNSSYTFDSGHFVVGHGYRFAYDNSGGYFNIVYLDVWYGTGGNGVKTVSDSHMLAAINANKGLFIW